MRIEISSTGFGDAAVSELQSNLASYIGDAESVLSSFKAINRDTVGLNGGIGNLQGAIENVDSRIQTEEDRIQDAKDIQNKVNEFVSLAERIDESVSEKVNGNKEELYRVSPWLKPVTSVDEEGPWYEQAWNWLCGAGETITDGAKQVWNWVSDTSVKVWNGIVEFYQEHKKVIDTVVIVVGAVAAVVAVGVSGGWALVPLLINVFGIQASTAIAISTAVAVSAVITTITSSILNIIDIWAEIDNPIFKASQKILNISSALLNITYSIGNIYNSFKGYRITSFDGVKVIQNDGAFDPMQVDTMGNTNMERMARKQPLAPIGKDGKSVELHHLLQTKDGGLIELTQKAHRGKGAYSFWHITDRKYRSLVDHGMDWINFTKSYWRWRGSNNFFINDLIIKGSSLITDIFSGRELLKR